MIETKFSVKLSLHNISRLRLTIFPVRWNGDRFQFSPSAAATKHSRQSSYRQQGPSQGPAPAYTQQL